MDSGLIGRDTALAEISAFASATSGMPAALAITGEPGIGKTAVWKHTVQAASGSSRVLTCQPARSERPLAFSALDDLLAKSAEEVLAALAGPRRRAMEAALLRDASPGPGSPSPVAETGSPVPERRALARGLLDAFQFLSGRAPLVIAIDDAQWLDGPSASTLEFCVRRLQCEPVLILLTFRTGDPVPLGLDRALPPGRLGRVQLGPLSLGAIGEILRSRLGVVLPRHTLSRLYDACGGNPFYAIESARALLDRPALPRTNEPLPIPPSLGDLVQLRLRRMTPDVRRVVCLVAAAAQPREWLIRAAVGDQESWAAIDEAIDAGILERDGEALRFTHPLLRSVLYAEMTPSQRRATHRRLAASGGDVEERAWHRALGADRPSEEIAGMLDGAARHAASRGAPEEAAALAEQATRLTPAGDAEAAHCRTVAAADYHFRSGDMTRSRELIQSALASSAAGPVRARLLLRLATIYYHRNGWPLAEQTFREAAQEAGDNPALRAHAEQELAFARLVAGDIPAALELAVTSLRSAERSADPRLVAHSLVRIAALEFLRGNGVRPELLDRAERLDAAAGEEAGWRPWLFDPALARGVLLKWCDRLDEARLILARQYRQALERGDDASLPFVLYHLSELECWAGSWDAAEEYALEGCRVADENRQLTMRPATLYALALVRAHRGQLQQAREIASEALALCDRTGALPIMALVLSVLGFAALSVDDHQAAHAHLSRLADVIAAFGLGEPGAAKFIPDEVEALAALGEIRRARSLAQELETRGASLGRRWALTTGARCRAHLAAADGDLEGAQAACTQALAHHEQLSMPFELGRTLLVKGMIERRARRKPAARASLGQALVIFERLGAPLWADKARRELSKITTGRPVGGLTSTERSIAGLIAQGQTNREVASALFVTQNTVQTHVRHIFQKLGVRSRTELAARILATPKSPATATGPAGSERD